MSRSDVFNPVLVTGGGGFVGCCAARRLLEEGFDVHVLLRPDSGAWRLEDVMHRLVVHRVDLADAEAVQATVRKATPAAILHMAAYGTYEWQAEGRRIIESNVLGSLNLLEASLTAGVRVFVNAGSSSEYGYKSEPMRETDRPEPNSIYGVAKAAQTHLAALMARKTSMAVVTFRLFSVYGPWEEPSRLLPTIIRRARAGLPLEMAAPDTARDFVYVDDVLRAVLDFKRLTGMRGDVINIGSGVQSTLKDVVDAVLGVVGGHSEVRWGEMPARRWDTNRWQADVSKARAILGWSPRYSLFEGVAQMAQWMERAGSPYAKA
jgi:nucleoside-diphosphate-sugar epimerase